MEWIVYILECADGTLYTGITNNMEKRLAAHTEGKGAKYTRGRGPFKVKFSESHKTCSLASTREREIKMMSREQKRTLTSAKQAR